MPNYREIIIHWEFRKVWNPEAFEKQHNQQVLYQVYCDSHIYGRQVLAYIGKTDATFRQRWSQHEQSFWKFTNNVNYAVGIIEDQSFGSLEIPESILIANHKPFFNKEYLHYINPKAMTEKIIVINNGDHGSLKNACTNFWWVDELLNPSHSNSIQSF